MENFAYGDVAATFNDSQTTLSMFTGHTSRFTTFPCMAVLFNITDHDTPHEAFFEPVTPDAEIIEIVSKSGDTFNVIKRGQDGTSAIATTSGKTYRVAVIASRSQWLKVNRAPPDASGPFDAILEGTALAVANAVFRFVKDNGVDDAVGSIQGSSAEGDRTSLWLGDTATADNVKIELQKSAAATDRLSLIMNSLPMMTFEGRNRIGIMKAVPGVSGGIDIGENVHHNKLHDFSTGNYTIDAGGALNNVSQNFIRVSANGGPGADDLETINLLNPPSGRCLLFVEPQTTAHDITVKDGIGNIHLSGGDFIMNVDDELLVLISRNTSNTEFHEVIRTGP